MKYRWMPLLLALLCGCTARAELPAEAPAEVIPPPVIQKEIQPPVIEEPEKEDTLSIKNGVATITLGSKRIYDGLCLQGLNSEGTLTISINGEEIYSQENNSVERWCWLDEQSNEIITIQLPEGSDVTGFLLSEPAHEAETRFSAYLPYSSFTDKMLSNGSLEALDELTINVGCYWLADGSLEIKNGLTDIFTKIQAAYPNLELYCTINPKKGGVAAVMTAEKRAVLIENMLTFCQENQLNGVDIDWEFPAVDQWDEFSALLCELSQSLDTASMRLSAAFYPEDVTLSSEAIKVIHKVNVMAYDQFNEEGYHSTYETAIDAIDYFLSLGFEAEQLSLGIPAYGRPLSGEAVWPLYYEYADQLIDGTNLLNDNYFNSPQLAQDKALFARENGLHGVFLYHLGCDLAGNNSSSLTHAIQQVLN